MSDEWLYDEPADESNEAILADLAAGRDGPDSVLNRLLEHAGGDQDFPALFELMPPGVQQRAIRVATINRDNFDAIIADFPKGDRKARLWTSYRDWARTRPEIMSASVSPSRHHETILGRALELGRKLETVTDPRERAALEAELERIQDFAR
jgi:hypothetical protein